MRCPPHLVTLYGNYTGLYRGNITWGVRMIIHSGHIHILHYHTVSYVVSYSPITLSYGLLCCHRYIIIIQIAVDKNNGEITRK